MKLGMVFEGGASRTAFSCGVMDAFLEEELMPDYFIGVSAGIAFGVSYLSKQKGRNLKLLEEYNLNPEECIFIDDMLINIEGAKAVNIKGIQFISTKDLIYKLRECGVEI